MDRHNELYESSDYENEEYEWQQRKTEWYMRFLQADGTYTQSHRIPPELIPQDLQNATDELVDRANSHMKKPTDNEQ